MRIQEHEDERRWFQRTCAYNVTPGWDIEKDCGKQAVTHVRWDSDKSNNWTSPVCEEHKLKAIMATNCVQYHDLGEECGTLGSEWHFKLNKCVIPPDLVDRILSAQQVLESA